jgi:hypothetical protein
MPITCRVGAVRYQRNEKITVILIQADIEGLIPNVRFRGGKAVDLAAPPC